jgi:hypothetical protein
MATTQCEKVVKKLRSVTYIFRIWRDTVTEDSCILCLRTKSNFVFSSDIWGASPHKHKVLSRKSVWLEHLLDEDTSEVTAPWTHVSLYLINMESKNGLFPIHIFECMKFFVKSTPKSSGGNQKLRIGIVL